MRRAVAAGFVAAALALQACAYAADAAKVLRVSMDGEEAGFDPQGVGDSYSFTAVGA